MHFHHRYNQIVLTLLFVLFTPLVSSAASLQLSPRVSSKTLGENFSLNIRAESTDQALNAVSAQLRFDPEYVEIVSVSRSNSVIDFWSQEPSYSNSSGSLSLEGVVFNGYLGSGANIATVLVRPKKSGSTTIQLASGDILANDGVGTSILSSLGKADITIQAGENAPQEPAKEVPVLATSDIIPLPGSPTHPDQERWYQDNNPIFNWELPESVLDVDFVISQSPDPEYQKGVSRGRIAEVRSFDQEDGSHYFHLVFKTKEGWSASRSFVVNIDTTAPESFFIQEVYRSINGAQASFLFEAEDMHSGISHFDINIDGQIQEQWDRLDEVYTSPQLDPGIHTMQVAAVDMAGNMTSQEFIFRISGDAKGAFLNDYMVTAALILLFMLILFLCIRYTNLLRAYHHLAEGETRKTARVNQKRLQSKMQTIEKAQKELKDLERKIQEELNGLN